MSSTSSTIDNDQLRSLQYHAVPELTSQAHLHRDPFTRRHSYTQTLLHTDTCTHRHIYTPFHTQTLLHTEPFTHRLFYTQTLVLTDTFTQRPFHTQTLLHTEPFTHRHLYTQTHFYLFTGKNRREVKYNISPGNRTYVNIYTYIQITGPYVSQTPNHHLHVLF